MIELVLLGVVAGFLAGISPCILPVLPVVLVAGATGRSPSAQQTADDAQPKAGVARSVAIVVGLALSFSILILAGSEIISLLHLPQDSLRDAGIALLILVGLGYLIPPLGDLLERPFSRIRAPRPNGRGGGFVLGLALGVLYVPCAGPILAAITVAGATHRVGLTAVFVTAAFAVGTAIPLLAVALAGGQLSRRVSVLRRHAPQARLVGGAVLIVMAVAIAFNTFQGLQRDVPSYSTALQGSAKVRSQLNALSGVRATSLTPVGFFDPFGNATFSIPLTNASFPVLESVAKPSSALLVLSEAPSLPPTGLGVALTIDNETWSANVSAGKPAAVFSLPVSDLDSTAIVRVSGNATFALSSLSVSATAPTTPGGSGFSITLPLGSLTGTVSATSVRIDGRAVPVLGSSPDVTAYDWAPLPALAGLTIFGFVIHRGRRKERGNPP